MYRVQICESTAEFATSGLKVDDLAPEGNIEASLDWFDLLHRQVFADDPGVRYYHVGRSDRPLVIFPLRLKKKGWVRMVVSLSNYYTTLFAPLVTDRNHPGALGKILAKASHDHGVAHVMRFEPMDRESLAYKGLMDDIRAIGWLPFEFFCFGNWFLRIGEDWSGYLKTRSANLRSTLKRMNNKFAKDGGLLEVVTGSEGIERAIAGYQEVYAASWKKPEPYADFVPSLIRLLSYRGMLRLGIAYLNGRAIAAQLWIVGQGKASIYKVAYNEEFSGYSPGTVLTGHLMRHVIEYDQVVEVDFLMGDDKYKKIWMSDRRERWGIVAYNPRTVIGLGLAVKESIGRIAKSARNKSRRWLPRTKAVGA